MADRMCDRKPVLTWLSWQKKTFFYRSLWDLRSRRCRCTHTFTWQSKQWVSRLRPNPSKAMQPQQQWCCIQVLRDTGALAIIPELSLWENKDVNSVLMLLLNCLLDKQGTVLCNMLCVYFRKGTAFWGPKINGRDGCSLNLARLNVQQEILLFEYMSVSSTLGTLLRINPWDIKQINFFFLENLWRSD